MIVAHSTELQDRIAALREAGRSAFGASGLPTRRTEAWRYTDVNRLQAFGFEPQPASEGAAAVRPEPFLKGEAHRLVFVNGRFVPSLSEIGSLPAGVILGGLADCGDSFPGLAERLGAAAVADAGPMVALNSAWFDDGLALYVPDGVALDRPIEVTFLNHGPVHPRNVVALGVRASAVLVERHLGDERGGLANCVSEITIRSGAVLRHYLVHSEPEASLSTTSLYARLERDSRYFSFVLTAGGGLVRHQADLRLTGPGGECRLDGAYLVDGDRQADIHALIDHQAAHCSSRQVQKGIVDDRGRAAFIGKIRVAPHALKSDGSQLSQTMLLSPQAEVDVKPELEIHADDVKCSHGATFGRIDPDALFYLRSRGISEPDARALLIQAFVEGAVELIDDSEIRARFVAVAEAWLERHARTAVAP